MLNDFGFWAFIVNILVLVVSISGFIKITHNDLKHLEKDVRAIKTIVEKIDIKADTHGERLSAIEGKCAAMHG